MNTFYLSFVDVTWFRWNISILIIAGYKFIVPCNRSEQSVLQVLRFHKTSLHKLRNFRRFKLPGAGAKVVYWVKNSEKDYRGQDLNLHTLRRQTLNLMRLPIPPPRGCFGYYLDLYVPLVSGNRFSEHNWIFLSC